MCFPIIVYERKQKLSILNKKDIHQELLCLNFITCSQFARWWSHKVSLIQNNNHSCTIQQRTQPICFISHSLFDISKRSWKMILCQSYIQTWNRFVKFLMERNLI